MDRFTMCHSDSPRVELMRACAAGRVALIREILSGWDVCVAEAHLDAAVQGEHPDAALFLLEETGIPPETAFRMAIEHGSERVLEELLHKRRVVVRDRHVRLAIGYNRYCILRRMLREALERPHGVTMTGKDCLLACVRHDRADIFRRLVGGWGVLVPPVVVSEAVRRRREEILEYLDSSEPILERFGEFDALC